MCCLVIVAQLVVVAPPPCEPGVGFSKARLGEICSPKELPQNSVPTCTGSESLARPLPAERGRISSTVMNSVLISTECQLTLQGPDTQWHLAVRQNQLNTRLQSCTPPPHDTLLHKLSEPLNAISPSQPAHYEQQGQGPRELAAASTQSPHAQRHLAGRACILFIQSTRGSRQQSCQTALLRTWSGKRTWHGRIAREHVEKQSCTLPPHDTLKRSYGNEGVVLSAQS